MAHKRFVVHVSSAVWEGRGIAVVIEYEIIKLKYIGNAYMLCLLWFGAPKDIILWTIWPGSVKFEGKYFYKLIQYFFQRIWPTLMRKWPKWNKITRLIWLWMYQKQYVNFPGKQGLAINLPWPALKSKQHFEIFDIISCQPGVGDNLFYCCVYNIHVTKHNLVLQIIENISLKHLSWICQPSRLFL